VVLVSVQVSGQTPSSRLLAERFRTIIAEPKRLVSELVPAYRLMTWPDATRCCELTWSKLQARCPRISEYYAVSPVVFDDARMKAFLYVERHMSGLHNGSSQELRKIDGRWLQR
jgi:hypothetical protein